MKKLIFVLGVLGLLALMPASTAYAQLAASNSTGVSMGHVHLIVQDLDAAKTFWTAMGGVHFQMGPNEGFKFPGVIIFCRKGDQALPSVGSVVGHFGFHVPDTTAALARWKAAGLKTEVGQNPGQGFVWTPDNLTRIEILEDKTQTVPIAFHHVHFYVADPSGTIDPGNAIVVRENVRRDPGKARAVRRRGPAGSEPHVHEIRYADSGDQRTHAGSHRVRD